MAKIPYFPFYPDDYLSSPGVTTCDLIDEGVYIRLLAYSWKHDGCQLPDDIDYLRRLCKGVRTHIIERVLNRHFERIELAHSVFIWRNARLHFEFGLASLRSEHGRTAAKALWKKKKDDARAMPEQCSTDAYQNQNQNQKESKDISVRKKRETDPRIKIVIDYFYAQCQSVLGFAPAINGGQDGKRVQAALRVMPLDDVKKCIDFFLPSKKRQELGCTLSIALSAHTINLYKQGGSNGTRYDQLKSYFGISERRGSDGLHHRGNSPPRGNISPKIGSSAGTILDAEVEEIPEMESE